MRVLASTEKYRIVFHQAGKARTDIVVITFAGQPHSLDDKGFGTEYCLRHGWDTIYVSQLRGTEFQGLSREAFLEVVAPEVEGRDVVCYGSSLGGYTAFYYGGSLDARIIAAAPVFPALMKVWRGGESPVEFTHSELKDVPRTSKSPFIIYDPMQTADKEFLDRAIRPAYPEGLRVAEYERGGHTVLETLKRVGRLSFMADLIERDEFTPPKPLEPGDFDYHLTNGTILKSRDPDQAIEELERALAVKPSNRVTIHLLPMLIRQGRLDRAQEIINDANNACDDEQRISGRFRDELLSAGLEVESDDVVRERIRAKRLKERRAKIDAARREAAVRKSQGQ